MVVVTFLAAVAFVVATGVIAAQTARLEITLAEAVTGVAGVVLAVLVALLKRVINNHDDERSENKKRLDVLDKTVSEMKTDITVLKDRARRSQ